MNNQAEQDWLQATFPGRNLWIGINDATTEGTFVWSSGQPATYTNWASGHPIAYGPTYDSAYFSGNGQWRSDYPSDGAYFPGLIELDVPSAGALSGGEGPLAHYLLDVDVADLVPPTLANLTRLPVEGTTTSELIGGFSASFSEALDTRFTNLNQQLYSYNGHYYLVTNGNLT